MKTFSKSLILALAVSWPSPPAARPRAKAPTPPSTRRRATWRAPPTSCSWTPEPNAPSPRAPHSSAPRCPTDACGSWLANVRNRENRRIQVQINCVFKDAQGFPTGDETAWRTLFLDENATEGVEFVSMNDNAKEFHRARAAGSLNLPRISQLSLRL